MKMQRTVSFALIGLLLGGPYRRLREMPSRKA